MNAKLEKCVETSIVSFYHDFYVSLPIPKKEITVYHLKNKTSRVIMVVLFSIVVSLSIINRVHAYVSPYILLPSDEISMQVDYPGTDCYYNVILCDVPSGYHVSDGIYLGWCVDKHHYIDPDKVYKARMYSSYDPENPKPNPNWDKVNYILNNKRGTRRDIQEAIWYFVEGEEPLTEGGRNLVNDAEKNGEGFVPAPGQILAVILWIDNKTQVSIIEVSVPFQNVVPEYPFGPIMGTFIFIAALCAFKYKQKIPEFLKMFQK